jgi:hemerythrin-like domain-containing protein
MARPTDKWHAEHLYFKQLLNLLQKEVDAFAEGRRPNYTLMVDIISYLTDYTDQYHHPREDVAFRRLAHYCPDLDLTLARLAQEHRVIAHEGKAFLKLLDDIISGATVPTSRIESAAATYLVYYYNHIFTEETEVLTRAEQFLKEQDWVAVRDAAPPSEDPLFGKAPADRFRDLRRQIARETNASG